MTFYTYLLKSTSSLKVKTYVGYTNNIEKRLNQHNSNKGAKSTKGYFWKLIYKKEFDTKSEAMSFEYKLKKNRNLRKKLLTLNKL
jgi:putative endonuclease